MSSENDRDTEVFSTQYVADVIQGYSAEYKNGTRVWRIDAVRKATMDAMIRLLDPQEKERVLEIGCGFGPVLYRIISQVQCRCVGIDISLETLAPVQKFFDGKGLSGRVSLLLAIGQELPFKREVFNKVMLIDVLEHMDDLTKKAVVSAAFEMLPRDGMLLINTPNLIYLKLGVIVKKILRIMTFRDPSVVEIPLMPTSREKGDHCGLTDAFFLMRILRGAGFKRIEMISRVETSYGKFLAPFWKISPFLKQLLCQTVTLKCFKE